MIVKNSSQSHEQKMQRYLQEKPTPTVCIEEQRIVKHLSMRSALHLATIPNDGKLPHLIVDNMYSVDIIDSQTGETLHELPIKGESLRSIACYNQVLFLGLKQGSIECYDTYSFEHLNSFEVVDKAEPLCMFIDEKTGTMFVGLKNGKIQKVEFIDRTKLQSAGSVYVPHSGQIFKLLVTYENEICAATYSGLFFGSIVTKNRLQLEWETKIVYFKEKFISEVCQIGPSRFVVANYSVPEYFIVNR